MKYFNLLFLILFCKIGFAQTDDCSAALMSSAAGCIYSSSINTSASTASAQNAFSNTDKDDDTWYTFTSYTATGDLTLKSLVQINLKNLVYSAGTTGVVVELWGNCTDASYIDYFSSSTNANDSCIFRNLATNTTYRLRIYTKGITSRISSGTLCVTYPCRNTDPGASCQGGRGIGSEKNDDHDFHNEVSNTEYIENGCNPTGTRLYNTTYATQSMQASPNGASVDDDVWIIFETEVHNNLTLRLYDATFLQAGTQLACELWTRTATPTLVATSTIQNAAGTVDFVFNTPQFSQNTVYNLRIYTIGTGCMNAITSFRICDLYSITNYDEAATAAPLNISSSTNCAPSPSALNYYTTSGATASAQTPAFAAADANDDVWFSMLTPASINTMRIEVKNIQFYSGFGPQTFMVELWNDGGTSMINAQQFYAASFASDVKFLFGNLSANTNYKMRLYLAGNTNRLFLFRLCAFAIPTPANDNCASPELLIATEAGALATCTPDATVYSCEGATASSQTPAFAGAADDDVWFSFRTTNKTQAIVQLNNVVYFAVQQGMVAELWNLDCNTMVQSSTTTFGSSMNFRFSALSPFTTYHLRIYSYNSGNIMRASSFNICVKLSCNKPVNDNYQQASLINLNNKRSATALSSCGNFSTCGATPDNLFLQTTACDATPAASINDVFIKFVPVSSSTYFTLNNIANANGGNNNLVMALYRYNPFTFTYEAQTSFCTNTNTLNINDRLIIGDTFLIRVYNTNVGSETNFELMARTPVAVSNDECANAIALTTYNPNIPYGNSVDATNLNAYNSNIGTNTGCNIYINANSDMWFSFRPTQLEHVMLRAENIQRANNIGDANSNGNKSLLYVLYSGNCGALVQIACGSLQDEFPTLLPATKYYLKLYCYDPQAQIRCKLNIFININYGNNDCATASTMPALDVIPLPGSLADNPANWRNGNTSFGSTSHYDCFAPYPVKGVWYKFQATAAKHTIRFRSLVSINPEQAFPDVAYRLFSGNDCATIMPISCTSSFAMEGGLLSGLTIGDWYYLRLQSSFNSGESQFQFGIYGANTPPLNNNITGAETIIQEPICLLSTRGRFSYATLSTDPIPAAAITANVKSDVWYKFRASVPSVTISLYQNFINKSAIIYAPDGTTVLQSYFSLNSGSFTTGALFTPGLQYYIRLFTANDVDNDFQICITGVPNTAIASAPFSSCTDADENPINFNNLLRWRHFTKAGKLLLSVYDDQPNLNDVSARYYLHPDGVPRFDGSGQPYLSRNIGIIRTGSAGPQPIDVMFYISKQELDDLIAANTGAPSDVFYLNDLVVFRFPTEECGAAIFSSNNEVHTVDNYGLLPGTTNVYYIKFRTNNFSGFFLKNLPTGILSLNPINFNAFAQNNNGILKWETKNIDIDKFIVQRSTDGVNFIDINQSILLQPNGKYNFTDVNAFQQANKIYYRIVSINKLGNKVYSATKYIKKDAENISLIEVYPNPSNGQFNVNINNLSSPLKATITAINGKLIKNITFMQAGTTAINLASYANGIYILKTDNGAVIKLIKQ